MNRSLFAALVVVLAALVIPLSPAYAEGPPACVVNDTRIAEGSGLVATADGYRIVNDGGDKVVIYRLDGSCTVTGVTTAAVDPYDVEDLAAGPNGTLWLADTGDNNTKRESVAVIVVPDNAGTVTPVLRRLQYPDGPHDAESMIVDDSGRAIILTKTFVGLVGIYRSDPLDLSATGSSAPQPLQKVGEIQLQATKTPGGPVGPPVSNLMSTGAARCGNVTALRTYTDVYFWWGTDPATAITDTKPVVTALAPQQQGESIAFSPDCTAAYVHGEGVGVAIDTVAVPAEPAASAPAPATGSDRAAAASDRRWWFAGGLALAGVLVVLAVRRARLQ